MTTKWIPAEEYKGKDIITPLIVPIKPRSKILYLIDRFIILLRVAVIGSGIGGIFYLVENLIKNN